MADKKEIVIESVRKLLALKLSDEEIVTHLKEVGVGARDARQIILIAKQKPKAKMPEPEMPKPIAAPIPKPAPKPITEIGAANPWADKKPEPKKEIGAIDWLTKKMGKISRETEKEEKEEAEELAEEISEQQPQAKKVKQAEKPEAPKPAEIRKEMPLILEPAEKEPAAKPKPSIDISKLWERGILASVDKKLHEIKEIREDLDKEITEQADKVAKKEVNKIQILFESQQSLFLEKANSKLEEKGKEVDGLIDKKIEEMKKISAEIKKESQMLEAKKEDYEQYFNTAKEKVAELDDTKKKLVSEMNSELIKSKSENQEFLDSAKIKIEDMAERVNKTLEVGLSALEGLRADAESSIDDVVSEKVEIASRDFGKLEDTSKAFEIQIKEHLQKISRLEKALEEKNEKMEKLYDSFSKKAKKK